MQPTQQIEIAKVCFNLTVSPKSAIFKHNVFRDSSSKRYKYLYQRKNQNEQIAVNYNKFNDSQNFYALNGNQYYTIKGSNLLHRSQGKNKQKNINEQKPAKLKVQTAKTTSAKVFNIQIIDPSYSFNELSKYKKNTKERMRPKSSLDRGINKNQKNTLCFQSRIQKNRHINPYTHEQYLYFRRKERQKAKQKFQEVKRKQLFINMMKPCQIFQKQINARQIFYNTNRPQTAKIKQKKLSLHTTLTSRLNNQDSGLQPWDYNQQNIHQEYLN